MTAQREDLLLWFIGQQSANLGKNLRVSVVQLGYRVVRAFAYARAAAVAFGCDNFRCDSLGVVNRAVWAGAFADAASFSLSADAAV